MRTPYFFALFLVITLNSLAQGDAERLYKPFKVDIAIGYAMPANTTLNGGFLFAVEPKYSVLPQLAVGIKFEGVGISKGADYNDVNNTVRIYGIGAYLATADYYFINDDFRPFAGLGTGVFTFSNYRVNNDGAVFKDSKSEVKFGGMARGGFEYKHFRLGLEYNIVANTNINGSSIQNSYFAIKAGFTIGGGLLPE